MHLFCRCHADHAAARRELESSIARMETRIRAVEGEAAALHADVRRWMRRAVAAERAVDSQDVAQTTPPPATQQLTGVRARRLARQLRGDPRLELNEGETNGVHS